MKDLGVLVPIVTPCSRSGKCDADGVRSVCDDMLDVGAHGIFVAGSSGRGPWFTRDECAQLCQVVADHIDPHVPLLAGCMDSGLADMLANARAMADAGATVAVVTAPGYFNYNPQEIESTFTQFADASPLPVVIYDIPAFAGGQLETDSVMRMAQHKNVIGFKDSSADFKRFKRLAGELAETSDFWLLQGKENLLVDSIVEGASGFVASIIHINPKPFVALYEAVRGGDMARARHLQDRIDEVFRIVTNGFARRPETSTLFHFLNAALRFRGVCDNILLAHEGETPSWITEEAKKTLATLSELPA